MYFLEKKKKNVKKCAQISEKYPSAPAVKFCTKHTTTQESRAKKLLRFDRNSIFPSSGRECWITGGWHIKQQAYLDNGPYSIGGLFLDTFCLPVAGYSSWQRVRSGRAVGDEHSYEKDVSKSCTFLRKAQLGGTRDYWTTFWKYQLLPQQSRPIPSFGFDFSA